MTTEKKRTRISQNSRGMRGRKLLRLLPALAAASFFFGGAMANAESSARSFHFDIAAAPLSEALRHYGQVSGQEIIFTEDLVEGRTVTALKGDYTARAALDHLLEGTGLTAERSPSGALMIRRPQPASKTSLNGDSREPGTNDGPDVEHAHGPLSIAQAEKQDPAASSAEKTASRDSSRNPESGATLQEVVVTAQKRIQNLQEVGVAVTAIQSEGLAMLGHQDVSALTTQVPSLQVNQFNAYQTIFNIRGVSQNDISDGQEAPIAFYNDEVYIGAGGAISGQTFDLERIEVLRGPQGTLFGRNATGGLIQAITAKPTKTFEGYAGVTGGRFGQFSTEGAVSGPLSDQIRGRLAFSTNRDDGYVRRTFGSNGASTRFYAARAQIEADVGANGTLRVKLEYLRNDHEVPGGSNIAAGVNADGLGFALAPTEDFWGTGGLGVVPFPCPGCDAQGYRASANPLLSDNDFQGGFNRTYWNATVRYEHDLGFARLTSISSYQDLSKAYSTDADTGPFPVFIVENSQDLYQLSQELHLAGASDRLDWIAGLYGLKIHSNAHDRVGTPPQTPPEAAFFESSVSFQDTRSWAAFAQGEYKLDKLFSVIVGGRYSADRKELNADHLTNDIPLIFNASTYPDLAKQTYKSGSGKIELDAKPNTDTLFYFGVNRGTKSGGFQSLGFGPVPEQIPYGQEVLTNYEGGFKLTLVQGKLTFNSAAFHYDYRDYQAYSNIGLNQVITNRPAEINGLEMELAARPVSSLHLNVFVTHLFTARVEGIVLPSLRATDARMPQAPKWSVGGAIFYDVPVGGLGTLSLSTDWKYDSAQYFTALNAPIDREATHVVGDLRASFAPADSQWEAALFVNNVTDKRYRLFDLDVSGPLGIGQADYAPPRWYGGTLTYRFGAH